MYTIMLIDKTSLILIVGILSLAYMIYYNVTRELTTESYIRTNYMYIFGALLLMAFTNHTMEQNGYYVETLSNKLIPLILVIFVTLFALFFTPKENQVTKHIFWLGFILSNAILLFPIYKMSLENNIVWKVIITLGIMFIAMSYVAFNNPLGTFNGLGSYLFTGLCGLIIFQLLDLLFADTGSSEFHNRTWWYSIIGVALFNGFLLYDTQKIAQDGIILGETCIGKSHLQCADYPTKSLSIILDLLNLYTDLTRMYSE